MSVYYFKILQYKHRVFKKRRVIYRNNCQKQTSGDSSLSKDDHHQGGSLTACGQPQGLSGKAQYQGKCPILKAPNRISGTPQARCPYAQNHWRGAGGPGAQRGVPGRQHHAAAGSTDCHGLHGTPALPCPASHPLRTSTDKLGSSGHSSDAWGSRRTDAVVPSGGWQVCGCGAMQSYGEKQRKAPPLWVCRVSRLTMRIL